MSHPIHSSVIPNPIDTDLFSYHPKSVEHRKRILVLRSFSSRKYAGDIIAQAILELSQRSLFRDLQFHIQGWGTLFDDLVAPLRQFDNVQIRRGFVEHQGIPESHRPFGVFLCPTRQDAQGVSMCEAMSSGLVPITSPNTAIPEFVIDKQTGFLGRSPIEIADAIEYLYREPERFLIISKQASISIKTICGVERVIAKETELIEAMLGELSS